MLLERYIVSGDTVKFEMSKKLKSKMRIKEDFWYSYEGVDLKEIPFEILSIPFILNIAPVIWYSGLKLEIDSIDLVLYNALAILKESIERMYPDIIWSGDIKVNNTISTVNGNRSNFDAIILFSGGLDSITSSFKHIEKKQCLVTICGSDVKLSDAEGWDRVKSDCIEYANKFGSKNYFIRSNFASMFVSSKLNEHKSISSWWAYVQHGMALTSFMSIPSFIDNIKIGYIGSTHTIDFSEKPWGSKPEIDNNVKWQDFDVVHDCFDLTRQMKTQLVVGIVNNKNIKPPKLRVCYSSEGGGNCCKCEKCSRTITSFIIQNIDPKLYGFNVDLREFISNVKFNFLFYRYEFGDNEVYQWNDICINGPKGMKYEDRDIKNYISWLKTVNFHKYKNSLGLKFIVSTRKSKIISRIYKLVKKLYE